MKNTKISSILTKKQKEAFGILSIGTFLEYFDLYLYVHMAVLLNDLFFPKTDPMTGQLLSAMAFCSTFIFRPFGALIFGYIGDHYGRKATVVITTFMMAFCCFIMANLPTYAQIGITASFALTFCRILQGFSSMGEVIGAELYLTETIQNPKVRIPTVALITVFSSLGIIAALGIASSVLSLGINWRMIFWFGMVIALVGFVARASMRETPEFVDAKNRLKKLKVQVSETGKIIVNAKVNKKSAWSLFFLACGFPICFYFSYIYCADLLKQKFYFTPEMIIRQNFIVSIFQLIKFLSLALLSRKFNAIKIMQIQWYIMMSFVLIFPWLLDICQTSMHIFCLQIVVVFFGFTSLPGIAIFYKSIPIFKRFTYCTFTYALSRALLYVITSFGMIYLSKYLGHYGIQIIFILIGIAFYYSVLHFKKIGEQQKEEAKGMVY